MKLIKLHDGGLALFLNPDRLFLVISVPRVDGAIGFKTGICTGYKADGDMIVVIVDETPEQIVKMLLDC